MIWGYPCFRKPPMYALICMYTRLELAPLRVSKSTWQRSRSGLDVWDVRPLLLGQDQQQGGWRGGNDWRIWLVADSGGYQLVGGVEVQPAPLDGQTSGRVCMGSVHFDGLHCLSCSCQWFGALDPSISSMTFQHDMGFHMYSILAPSSPPKNYGGKPNYKLSPEYIYIYI